MKVRRLLLLLCLTVTAGSTSAQNGTCKNGTWKIDDNKLTVDVNGKMANYKVVDEGTNAPWYQYRENFKSIHISSNTKTIGERAFSLLYISRVVSGGENVELIKDHGFSSFDNVKVRFPKVKEVEEHGIRAGFITLPVVETLGEYALSNCSYIDLGSKIKTLQPGCMISESLWKSDGRPSVFMSNPTPPEYTIRHDRPWYEDIGNFLAYGVGGLVQDRFFECDFPFGDQPKDNPDAGIIIVIPEQYYDNYLSHYNTPGEPYHMIPKWSDYMAAYYVNKNDHTGWYAETKPCGRMVRGEPIYNSSDEFIGWWYYSWDIYKDAPEDLHVGFVDGKAVKYMSSNVVPWKSILGKVTTMYLHGDGDEVFTIPSECFKDGKGLQGIKTLYLESATGFDIGEGAFEGCTGLNIVSANDHEVTVGANAFKGCTALSSVKASKLTVGENAFSGCAALTSVSADVAFDGPSAFQGCNLANSRNLKIKGSSIPDNTFKGSSIYNVDLKYIKNIGKEAFYGTGIKDVNLSNFKQLGDQAFANSKVKTLTLGNQTPTIGSKVFMNCTSLTDIYVTANIPANTYPSDMFDGVKVENITLHVTPEDYANGYQGHPVWGKMIVDKQFTFPVTGYFAGYPWSLSSDGVLKLGCSDQSWVSEYNEGGLPWSLYSDYITDVVIEDGSITIDNNVFAGLENLVNVSIPRTVRNIGDKAFRGCTSLKNVYITRVETLGNSVFEDCSSLETIELGVTLKSAGDYVFRNCKNLIYIDNITDTPAKVTDLTFKEIKSSVYNQRRNAPAKVSEEDAAQYSVTLKIPNAYVTKYMMDTNWGKFHIPYADDRGTWKKCGRFGDGMWILYDDGTLLIAADQGPGDNYDASQPSVLGFSTSLNNPDDPINFTKEIEITGNITHLSCCFQDFKNLESVTLCPSVKSLNTTFMGCTNLTNINLENIETIAYQTFANTGLTSLSLPNTKSIGEAAFTGCTKLVAVALGSGCQVGKTAFGGCTALTTVGLNDANLDKADNCFNGCTSLTNVYYNGANLPLTIFKNCKKLEKVDLGTEVKTIQWSAFEGCTALKSVYCNAMTPPTLVKGTKQVIDYWDGDVPIGHNEDAYAFDGLTLSDIDLLVPADLIPIYKKENVWKDMHIVGDESYEEPMFPVGGSLGEIAWWQLDEKGTLTITGEGEIPWTDNGYGWYHKLDPWASFTKHVIYTDGITTIAPDITSKNTDYSTVETVEIGADVTRMNTGSMLYTDLTDIYCFAIEPPTFGNQGFGGCFNVEALKAKGTTLHVPDFYGTLEKYKNSTGWGWFIRIVADLPTRKPGTVYVESLELKPDAKHLAIMPDELGSYTYQIEPVIYPASATNKVLTWTSDNENVATVDENGLVTILAYPIDYNIVTITAVTTDGSNKKATCEFFIYNPEEVQGGIPATDLAINRTSITMMKSSKATVKVSLTPANSNSYVSTMIEGQGTIDVFEMFDPMTGVTQKNVFEITPRDVGTFIITFQATDVDWDQVSEYPTAVLTVNVLDDIIFTEKSAEGVPVTYIVNSLDENTCSLYGKREQEIWVDPETGIPSWGEETYYTAVDTETKGSLVIPEKAGGYYVVGVSNLAFRNCSQLTEVELSEGIQFVGEQAFDGCESLRELYLPSTMQGFGFNCFAMLRKLGDVYVFALTPPVGGFEYNGVMYYEAESSNAFDGIYLDNEEKGATLHVPVGCREAWDVWPWNMWFRNIVDEAVVGIGEIDNESLTPALSKGEGDWYSLDGRKLGSKPAKAGLYINNGKKVVIK